MAERAHVHGDHLPVGRDGNVVDSLAGGGECAELAGVGQRYVGQNVKLGHDRRVEVAGEKVGLTLAQQGSQLSKLPGTQWQRFIGKVGIEKVKEYAAASKDGSLGADKMQGGSFTVTNLGNLGIESFTPIINPPQTAILGVCGTMLRPRQKADGSVEYYQAMGLSLTFDHRVVDGAPAAKFLKAVADKLEKFNLILAL